MLSHLLIGVPASGKSTFALSLATLTNAKIVSTDKIRATLYGDASIQGDWNEIETEVIQQIKTTTSQGHSIIYDATNFKRAWRLEFLNQLKNEEIKWIAWYLQTPLEICKERNQKRDRHVPESIIESMYQSLKDFPPIIAEGFAIINPITTNHFNPSAIQKQINSISRRQINHTNRTQHPQAIFHSYSRLLDFERLLHLLSLLIQYPGLGNLHQTNPKLIAEIFGVIPHWKDSLEEIASVMEKLKGKIYADRDAIAQDLLWLQRWEIVNQEKLTQSPQTELFIETCSSKNIIAHPYSEIEPFKRLIITIRLILNHPFLPKIEKMGYLESLSIYLQQKTDIKANYYNCLRKDIERILKPYQIIPSYPMKHGYFAGTGILTAQELKSVYHILQSQAKSFEDPLSLKMYELLKERVSFSKVDQNEIYPVRAIANSSMIDLDYLHESILLHQLDELEQAIESGKLIELNRKPESGKFLGDTEGFFKAWPLQIVFSNFAWYLGYECAEGSNSGLFRLERLDRLFCGQPLSQFRETKQQWRSLKKFQKLLIESAGIFLGNSVEEQTKYLNSNRKGISDVEIVVEFHFTDHIFRFIAEVTKRFPQNKFKMSPLISKKPTSVKEKKMYSLSRTQDSQFPNRFQVIIPNWSLEDVDFIRWIVGFGGQVKVHQPRQLQERVYQIGKEIHQLYQGELSKY